jgi:hypothetical protein
VWNAGKGSALLLATQEQVMARTHWTYCEQELLVRVYQHFTKQEAVQLAKMFRSHPVTSIPMAYGNLDGSLPNISAGLAAAKAAAKGKP